MQWTISMNAETYEHNLLAAAEKFPLVVEAWLTSAAELTQREMKTRVNKGVGAAMGQGIENNIDIIYDRREKTAFVGPNHTVMAYAAALETGSKPHRPPAFPDSALAQWCEMKGLHPYAVAATIAKVGTQPHPYVEPTYDSVKEPIDELFAQGVPVFFEGAGL